MIDLFGNDHPEPAGKAAPAVQLGLVEHAAERAALRSGRPVSQERSEIVAPIERYDRCVAGGETGPLHEHQCDGEGCTCECHT
jgi:hypothetical protein